MATEIGKLTAIFDADTRKFDAGARGVATKVAGLTSSFGDLRGGVGSASTALAGMTSPLALTAGAAVVAASAISSIAVGLFQLVKNSAEAGGELFDLSQKTGVTVETLSTLSIVAKTTGSDIGSLSGSLGIFQKNMLAAGDATSKQGELFKRLKIDTLDNEKAIRQAFAALNKMGEGAQQTAIAMQLFGRSGKDVLAIVKETNGNLDEATKKYDQMGLTISTSAAIASDRFNDLLEETTLQLSAVTRSIGNELLPVASDALRSLSSWLAENKAAWSSWGTTIADVIRGVSSIAKSEIGSMIGWIAQLSAELTGLPALIRGLAGVGQQNKPSEDPFGPGGAARGGRKNLPGTPEWQLAQSRLAGLQRLGGGGGGRGGGGGGGGADPAINAKRIAELQLQAVINGLRAEEDANKRSLELRRQDFNTYAKKYMEIETARHEAVIQGLDAEQRAAERLKKGRDVALLEIQNKRAAEQTTHEQKRNAVLDDRGRILDQMNNFLRDQEKEIASLTNQTDRWESAYQQLVDTLKEEGVVLEANMLKRIRANIEQARELELILSITRARRVADTERERFATREGRNRPPWIDLGGGSTVGGEPGTTTRERVVTAEENAIRQMRAKIREQMRSLAEDLTGLFARSVGDGFEGGVKRGLATLAQGLLQIVQEIFLKRIAEGLTNILSGIGTGSGGGFLGGLLRSILGGAAGGLGGGVGPKVSAGAGFATAFAGGFANGGYLPPGRWGIAGERGPEPIFGGQTGMSVIPNRGGGVVNNYTINLPPAPRGSYMPKRSAREQADMLIAGIQGANR